MFRPLNGHPQANLEQRPKHVAKYNPIIVNPLTSNDPLISKRCILYIYSTNIGTEYFKHAVYSPFFFLFKMRFVS